MSKPLNGDYSSRGERDFFQTEHLKSDLKQRSIRGGAITISAQGAKFISTFVFNIILARLLTPADYGLVGMVMTVIGCLALFKDLGLSMATVQRENVNQAQVSTLFWINTAFSIVIALVVVALAPLIANFYNEPRLINITIASASGIAISGLGIQHAALLKRQMRYKALALNDVCSQSIGISVAIAGAYWGIGYWSLVVYPIVTTFASNIGFWLALRWRPGLPTWQPEIKSMLTFGGNMTGFSIVNYIARNLDNILIGKVWGTQQLGLYAKAYQLLLLPIQQINAPIASVAIPLLSRIADSPKRYREVYLSILEKLVLITMPLMVCMITTSDWLIELLLGKQWVAASRLFVWLGIVGIIQPISGSTGWLFISQGRSLHLFQWGLIGSTITALSFMIGISGKAEGVATAYCLTSICITTPLLFWFTGRKGPIRTKDIYLTILPSLCSSLVAMAVALAAKSILGTVSPVIGILCISVITVFIFAGVLLTIPQGRRSIFDFAKVVSTLRSGISVP